MQARLEFALHYKSGPINHYFSFLFCMDLQIVQSVRKKAPHVDFIETPGKGN